MRSYASSLVAACAVLQLCSASPTIIAENSDDGCHCSTELTLNIPPCTCSGVVETLAENQRLKELLKELKNNCTVDITDGFGIPYETPHVTVEGIRWTKFWWYNPEEGWPTGTTDVLGVPYGACSPTSSYCFGRLPGALREQEAELLAFDSSGTIYRWHFDPSNAVAHAAWNAFYHHLDQTVRNSQAWSPYVVSGPSPSAVQDSFMYRVQNGVHSLMLDDDNCDCYTTLSMGHGMCGTGFSTSYGPSGRYGVDLLFDSHCQIPNSKHGLILYFRDDNDCDPNPCTVGTECVDKVNGYLCV